MSNTRENPPESEIEDIFQGKENAVGSISQSLENDAGPGEESENHEPPTRAGNVSTSTEEFEIQPPPRETTPPATGTSSLAPIRKGWLSRVFEGKARREHQLQTLQTGYLEMLQMMRSIRSNLDRQSEMHCKLIETLEQFPKALKGMENVGKATEQQTKLLGVVQQQLSFNAEQDEKMIGSLNSFNETLDVMDETSRRSSQTIGTLVDHSRESESKLRNMLERSEKRMTSMMTMMTLVVLAAALFGGYIVIQNQGLRATIAPQQPAAPLEDKNPSVDNGISTTDPIHGADSQPDPIVPEQPVEEDPAPEKLEGSVEHRQDIGIERIESANAANPDWRNDPAFQSRVQEAIGGPRPGDPEPKGYKSVLRRVFSFYHGNDSRDPDSDGTVH